MYFHTIYDFDVYCRFIFIIFRHFIIYLRHAFIRRRHIDAYFTPMPPSSFAIIFVISLADYFRFRRLFFVTLFTLAFDIAFRHFRCAAILTQRAAERRY